MLLATERPLNNGAVITMQAPLNYLMASMQAHADASALRRCHIIIDDDDDFDRGHYCLDG